MEKGKKKDYVYSIRINKDQNQLLKKNEWVKKELNQRVLDFFKYFNT